jgi:hypothetical protein
LYWPIKATRYADKTIGRRIVGLSSHDAVRTCRWTEYAKGLVTQRPGILNQIRTFLLERGIAARQGLRFLRSELPRILAAPPDVLSSRMVGLESCRILDNAREAAALPGFSLVGRVVGCYTCATRPGRRGDRVNYEFSWTELKVQIAVTTERLRST